MAAPRDLTEFRRIVEEATAKIVGTQHRPDASFVRTPLMYPSGASVVVRIDGGPDQFFVSDFGMGLDEADLLGISNIYARQAPVIAQQAGVRFDSHAFFVVNVGVNQLPGAIATIANCSQEAVATSYLKASERSLSDAIDRLYERLIEVFPKNIVARQPEIIGSSNTKYRVASIVSEDRHRTIFDVVSKHPNSVAHASMKFQDIARLEQPPVAVAVVRRKEELGTYLGVLTQVGEVIEETASDNVLRRLARAA